MNIYLDGRPYSKKKPGQRPIFPAGKKGAVPHFSLQLIEPLGYLDFLKLMAHARVVLTDSGGIQEETTILGTPCLTLRENTERPVTVEMGTNRLVGSDPVRILEAYREVMAENGMAARTPPLWDGQAARRIAEYIIGG